MIDFLFLPPLPSSALLKNKYCPIFILFPNSTNESWSTALDLIFVKLPSSNSGKLLKRYIVKSKSRIVSPKNSYLWFDKYPDCSSKYDLCVRAIFKYFLLLNL